MWHTGRRRSTGDGSPSLPKSRGRVGWVVLPWARWERGRKTLDVLLAKGGVRPCRGQYWAPDAGQKEGPCCWKPDGQ